MNLTIDEELINTLKIIVPVLGVLLGGFIGARNLIKKNKIDQSSELKRKVRSIITTTMSLWDEIEYIKFLASSDSQRAKLFFIFPSALIKHCGFAPGKVQQHKIDFDTTINQIKEMDVTLFHTFEGTFDNTMNIINSGLFPVMKSNGFKKDKRSMVYEMASEISKELETIVRVAVKSLDKKERLKILSTLKTAKNRFSMKNPMSVPSHILALFKPYIREGQEVSAQAVIEFFENETVAWLLTKLPSIGTMEIDEGNVVHVFSKFENIDTVEINDASELPPWFPGLLSDLFKLHFTQKEIDQHLINNKPFYRLCLTTINPFSEITFGAKRIMVEVNNGIIDPNTLVETFKSTIPIQFQPFDLGNEFDLSEGRAG